MRLEGERGQQGVLPVGSVLPSESYSVSNSNEYRAIRRFSELDGTNIFLFQ